jgi:phage terminase large subunit
MSQETSEVTHTFSRSKKMYYPAAVSAGNSTYKHIAIFKPLKWQKAPWKDTSPILLLTGSAGGGKSRFAGEKIHGLMLRYDGAAGLILRKTKDSLGNSVLSMMEKKVIGLDPRVAHIKSKARFEYSNGSALAYMGMSDDAARERLRSIGPSGDGALDFVWIEEASEFVEDDYIELLARMRGVSAPFTQIILSTNPDGPAHWINIKLRLGGEASTYYSRAADNRKHLPDDYFDSLDKMTGVLKKRLVDGLWVTGSGVVFDTFLDDYNAQTGRGDGNVVNEAEYIPDSGTIAWAIDDGYSGKQDKATGIFSGKSHPRAILMCQIRQDGTIAVFNESFKIKTLAQDHLMEVRSKCAKNGWPLPEYVVRDRAAASLEGALKSVGISRVIYNQVDKDESIKEMRSWLAQDENGVRKVLIHPRCMHLRYEISQFSVNKKGLIIKEHDNGPDALRYFIWNEVFGRSPKVDIVTWAMVTKDG